MMHRSRRSVPALLLLGGLAACAPHPGVRETPGEAPEAAENAVRLITSDIANFWRAYDAAAGKDSAGRVYALRTLYLRPGSPGLRDWARLRLADRGAVRERLAHAEWSAERVQAVMAHPVGTPARDSLERAMAPIVEHSAAEQLAATLDRYPRYYAAVRAATLSVDTAAQVTSAIRRGLARIRDLYPDAKFPDVYFLIGNLSTGGTVGPSGMLIGTEQQVSTPDTPRDELPAWAQTALPTGGTTRLAPLVLHEAVHTLQPGRRSRTLLEGVLAEGVPDLVSELVAGPWFADTERVRYGSRNERAVWLDFKDEMHTDSTIRSWLSNGNVPPPGNHGANNIGYWVGYRIAKAYYEKAADKRAAIRELILLPDPERILRESGYAAYAEALP
jgi:hypothetical protein